MTASERTWERSIPADRTWGGCRVCAHFRPDLTCAAYPQRIPLLIAAGQVDHLVPRPGQVGETVFELARAPRGLARRLLDVAIARAEPWALARSADAFGGRVSAVPGESGHSATPDDRPGGQR